MKVNSVINDTFIICIQAEYSTTTQMVALRCILEAIATGNTVASARWTIC